MWVLSVTVAPKISDPRLHIRNSFDAGYARSRRLGSYPKQTLVQIQLPLPLWRTERRKFRTALIRRLRCVQVTRSLPLSAHRLVEGQRTYKPPRRQISAQHRFDSCWAHHIPEEAGSKSAGRPCRGLLKHSMAMRSGTNLPLARGNSGLTLRT